MFLYKQIVDLLGRQILDYRGNPAIEIEILCEDGIIGKASMSCMKSCPDDVMLFDFDYTEEMLHLINTVYADALIGENVLQQVQIDRILEKMWNTSKKNEMQKCILQTISMAVARTASLCIGFPLFRYLGGISAYQFPGILIRLYNYSENEQIKMNMTGISIAVEQVNLVDIMLHLPKDFYQKMSEIIKQSISKNDSIAILLEKLRNSIEKETVLKRQAFTFAIHKCKSKSCQQSQLELVSSIHKNDSVLPDCIIEHSFTIENTITETLKKLKQNQKKSFISIKDLLITEECFLLDLAAASGNCYIDLGIRGSIENTIITNQLIRILEHF